MKWLHVCVTEMAMEGDGGQGDSTDMPAADQGPSEPSAEPAATGQ